MWFTARMFKESVRICNQFKLYGGSYSVSETPTVFNWDISVILALLWCVASSMTVSLRFNIWLFSPLNLFTPLSVLELRHLKVIGIVVKTIVVCSVNGQIVILDNGYLLHKTLHIPDLLFCRFTYAKYFVSVIKELIDIAGQHESISENISSQIVTDLVQLVQTLRQDRKRVSCIVKLLYTSSNLWIYRFLQYY
jgi:hypothetical protein